MELNLTAEEFKDLYLNNTYKVIKEKTGLYDLQIANLAKQLGLTKPKGRAKTELKFKKGG